MSEGMELTVVFLAILLLYGQVSAEQLGCNEGELELHGACLFPVVVPGRDVSWYNSQPNLCAPRCSVLANIESEEDRTAVSAYLTRLNVTAILSVGLFTSGKAILIGVNGFPGNATVWSDIWPNRTTFKKLFWSLEEGFRFSLQGTGRQGALCMRDMRVVHVDESCLYRPRDLFALVSPDSVTCESTCGERVSYRGREMCRRHYALGGGLALKVGGRCHVIVPYRAEDEEPSDVCWLHGRGSSLDTKQFELVFDPGASQFVVRGIAAISSSTELLPYPVLISSPIDGGKCTVRPYCKAWDRGHITREDLRGRPVWTVCSEVHYRWPPTHTQEGAICDIHHANMTGDVAGSCDIAGSACRFGAVEDSHFVTDLRHNSSSFLLTAGGGDDIQCVLTSHARAQLIPVVTHSMRSTNHRQASIPYFVVGGPAIALVVFFNVLMILFCKLRKSEPEYSEYLQMECLTEEQMIWISERLEKPDFVSSKIDERLKLALKTDDHDNLPQIRSLEEIHQKLFDGNPTLKFGEACIIGEGESEELRIFIGHYANNNLSAYLKDDFRPDSHLDFPIIRHVLRQAATALSHMHCLESDKSGCWQLTASSTAHGNVNCDSVRVSVPSHVPTSGGYEPANTKTFLSGFSPPSTGDMYDGDVLLQRQKKDISDFGEVLLACLKLNDRQKNNFKINVGFRGCEHMDISLELEDLEVEVGLDTATTHVLLTAAAMCFEPMSNPAYPRMYHVWQYLEKCLGGADLPPDESPSPDVDSGRSSIFSSALSESSYSVFRLYNFFQRYSHHETASTHIELV